MASVTLSQFEALRKRLEAEEKRRVEGDAANDRAITDLAARVTALEATAPPPPTDTGKILFASDFSSFDGWYLNALPGRATIVNGWGRFEVRPGDEDPDTHKSRAEVSGPDFKEGEDLWVRHIFRRALDDTSTPKDWLLVEQFHEDNWPGSPANGVLIEEDWRVRLGNKLTYWQGPMIQKGVANDLLYRIKLSQGSDGLVEPFWNGVAQPVYKGPTMFAASVYLKAGIYRASASTGTSVIEHDRIVVATSMAAMLAV